MDRYKLKLLASPLILGVIGATVLGLILFSRSTKGQQAAVGKTAWESLRQAEALRITADLTYRQPENASEQVRLITATGVKMDGNWVRGQDGTPAFGGTIYAEVKGRGNIFFADGEIRLLGQDVLFKLNNLPVIINPSGSLSERWTLTRITDNPWQGMASLARVVENLMREVTPTEQVEMNGEKLWYFSKELSPAEKKLWQEAGARTGLTDRLANQDLSKIEVWAAARKPEVRQLHLTWQNNGSLELKFDNYNQVVTIDRPRPELEVKPEVFTKALRTGQAGEVF